MEENNEPLLVNVSQQSENESLRKEISQLKAVIADLQTRNAGLEKESQTNVSQQSEIENLRTEISQLKVMFADSQAWNANLEKENQILVFTHKLQEGLLTPALTPLPDSPMKEDFSRQRFSEEEIEHYVAGEECQRSLKELRKVDEVELQKELERLEKRHNQLKADLEAIICRQSESQCLRDEISQLKAEIADLQAGNADLEKYNRELKERHNRWKTVWEHLRNGQEGKALTLKDFSDVHGLNETGRSLHDEVEEAEALQVEEENPPVAVLTEGKEKLKQVDEKKLTVVAFEGQNDGKHSNGQSVNYLWRSWFQWFSTFFGSSAKSGSRLIQPIPMSSIRRNI